MEAELDLEAAEHDSLAAEVDLVAAEVDPPVEPQLAESRHRATVRGKAFAGLHLDNFHLYAILVLLYTDKCIICS